VGFPGGLSQAGRDCSNFDKRGARLSAALVFSSQALKPAGDPVPLFSSSDFRHTSVLPTGGQLH